MTLSEFIQQSHAEELKMKNWYGVWNVYVDGKNRLGRIDNCYGPSEYEAKEEAYEHYKSLGEEINNQA